MGYDHCNGRKVSVLEGEELVFNKVPSRESSVGCSSRVLYCRSAEGVPFQWEMKPGTPKDPPKEDILPPLSPPPAVVSLGLPKPCISVEEERKASIRSKLMFWKHNKKSGEINKKVQKGSKGINPVKGYGSHDQFENLELCSSSDGEEYFMGSLTNSSSSSSSSFSFSNVHSSQSSRLPSPARDSMDHGDLHGCGPWNFTSLRVRVGRKV